MRRALRAGAGAIVMFAVATMATGTAGASTAAAQQLFRNCDEARAAGVTDIARGEPGYSPELDLDSDGVACEADDAVPAPAPAPDPSTQTAPAPEVQGATQDALASTGLSVVTPFLLVAAVLMMLAGQRLIDASYERLDWLPGRRHSEVRFTVEPVRGRRRRR